MNLIYLAAGSGTRLGKITEKKPKFFAIVNKKKIIDYNKSFFSFFKKVFIVAGYKSYLIKKEFLRKKDIKVIVNKKYKTTNMVESAFLPKKNFRNNKDIIICYGDIIFDHQIIKKLISIKNKNNIMPLNAAWFPYWKKRMPLQKIKNDAENLIVKKNLLYEIGTSIKKEIPKLQFMGIIKLSQKSYNNLYKFYLKKNKKIDFTTFINESIKSKKIKFNYFKTKKNWLEIDSPTDLRVANKLLKKYNDIRIKKKYKK